MHSIIIFGFAMHLPLPVVEVMNLVFFKLLTKKIILLAFALLVVEFGSILLVNEKQNSSPTVRKVSSLVLYRIQLGIYGGMTIILATSVLLAMSDSMEA